MRVHLLAVPNTQPTSAFPLDGFCLRTQLFAQLLTQMGHEVILYGVEQTEAPCAEFVAVLSEAERQKLGGTGPYHEIPFDAGTPLYVTFNTKAAHAIRARKRPGDIIATIAGSAQFFVSEWHPELPFLEYSIGYRGVCAPYRIFQSHAWRHTVSGFTGVDGGRLFDAVIPPWFDPDDFPVRTDPDDYVLYCGRLVQSKGIALACAAARAAGVRLLLIGPGDPSLVTYGEYLGPVITLERNRLMAGAKAVLMPTQYLEPFGNVAAEAQLCGTPVLASEWGAFTESVEHGVSGYRCATLPEYVEAIEAAPRLDRAAIRARAVRLYSTATAAAAYAKYFARAFSWPDPKPASLERMYALESQS